VKEIPTSRDSKSAVGSLEHFYWQKQFFYCFILHFIIDLAIYFYRIISNLNKVSDVATSRLFSGIAVSNV
jgi:hypothetical protein